MMNIKSIAPRRTLTPLLAALVFWSLAFANDASAQGTRRYTRTIDAGTTIAVRTNEAIRAKDSDGRIFSGTVEQDVLDHGGNIAIPKGSPVDLAIKETEDNDLMLDLDSITVNGQRFGVEGDESVVQADRKEGIGANKRTGKYVGGGAVLGAIIGAIAGGGKGAAIGAGAGAAAGAGAQVLTRGTSIEVPSESLLTFRLAEPMRAPMAETGYYSRDGVRYNNRYASSASVGSAAYEAGRRAGLADRERGLTRQPESRRWTTFQDKRDYAAGYNRGYNDYVSP